MTMQVVPGRGPSSQDPKKASLCSEKNQELVTFMFNPTQYSVSKSNTWKTEPSATKDIPDAEFSVAGTTTITLRDLVFDTYESGQDVRNITNKIFGLMQIGKFGDQDRPPVVKFQWSGADVECVVTKVSQDLTMFASDGTPIRAKVSIDLLLVPPGSKLKLGTNPTSVSEPYRVRLVHKGETLDQIAYDEYGDSRHWRRIADFNKLTDPLRLRPGQRLAIPNLT